MPGFFYPGQYLITGSLTGSGSVKFAYLAAQPFHSQLNYFRFILILAIVISGNACAQITPSLSTDFMVVRNFARQQQYWSIGQNIRGEWHLDSLNGLYAGFSYSIKGKFNNALTATANDPATLPATINYLNGGGIHFSQISMGWKRYLAGNAYAETGVNVYGLAGLGLLFATVVNQHNPVIDTSLYHTPVPPGRSKYNRLTLDMGLGLEVAMGGDCFIYGECKTYIPISTYPNRYLLNDKYTPLPGFFGIGVRVLFN